MVGLGIKTYIPTSIGHKMHGSSKTLGQKIYGGSPIPNKPNVSSHPDTLYNNSHNSNIAYVPFGTKQINLHEDKLNLHSDTIKKHSGQLTRLLHKDQPPARAIKKKLFN